MDLLHRLDNFGGARVVLRILGTQCSHEHMRVHVHCAGHSAHGGTRGGGIRFPLLRRAFRIRVLPGGDRSGLKLEEARSGRASLGVQRDPPIEPGRCAARRMARSRPDGETRIQAKSCWAKARKPTPVLVRFGVGRKTGAAPSD